MRFLQSEGVYQLPGAAQELEAVYRKPVLLSTEMMEEGLSNLGDTRRLERAVFKLVNGELLSNCSARQTPKIGLL